MEDVRPYLYIFATFLAMINPLEAAGAFGPLMAGVPAERQARIAKRATVYATLIFLVFGLVGNALLGALGISVAAFEIGGGLLLMKVGFDMVFAQNDPPPEASGDVPSDPSVFPLAIPIISGPGALTAAVTAFGKQHYRIEGMLFVVAAAIVAFGITYIAMRSASRLSAAVGASGIQALSRLVGILVTAIAIQLVVDGLSTLTRGFIHLN